MRDMRVSVGAYPTEIDCIWNLTNGLTYIVLANSDRWILATGATRHGHFIPGNSVIGRHSRAIRAGRVTHGTGGVRNIDCALWRYLHVPVDATEALTWSVDYYSWAKGYSAIIAP